MATAQQVFGELANGDWRPFYLVVGEEPFQASEIKSKLKEYFVKDQETDNYNFEQYYGEDVDPDSLRASLDTLPGLFDLDGGSTRFVICHHFDKVTGARLEKIQPYFKDPSPSSCFLMTCTKVDKRKGWYKAVEAKGSVIEVREPYDREWPRWHGYFQSRIGKNIDFTAWQMLVESSGRSLSALWAELQKVATYVGERSSIESEDVEHFVSSLGAENVFRFIDEVMDCDKVRAVRSYHRLKMAGENEIKILSLLVRQFRILEQYLRLSKQGVHDSKILASHLGIPGFFVSKVGAQAERHSPEEIRKVLGQLSECDYRLKTGAGRLFEDFLIPYFT